MNELGATQVNLIARDVRKQRITFSHLCNDLIDHICCDVENEMEGGLTFEKAYNKVKEKIGIRGLNKIQEETLYSVDTKYRRMKNTMKITGIAGTVMLSFGVIFKLIHYPFAGIMLALGVLLLAVFFLPSSLMVLWKETKSGRHILLFVSAFLAGLLFIVAALFKIQHWPGSGLLISISLISGAVLFLPSFLVMKLKGESNKRKRPVYILTFIAGVVYMANMWFRFMHWKYASLLLAVFTVLFFIIVPWYVYLEWKEEKGVTSKFIFLVIALVAIIIPSSLINLTLAPNFNSPFYIMADNSQQAVESVKTANENYLNRCLDSPEYDQLQNVHHLTMIMLDDIDSIKTVLLSFVGGPEYINGSAEGYGFKQMANLFDATSPQNILNQGSTTRAKLDENLTGFVHDIKAVAEGTTVNMDGKISGLKAILPDSAMSRNTTLISNIHTLNMLESALLVMESDVLRSINAKADIIEQQ